MQEHHVILYEVAFVFDPLTACLTIEGRNNVPYRIDGPGI